MPTIHLTSFVHAPADRVFDLARSTSVHKALLRSYKHGKVEGGTEGFIGLKDKISFSLRFLGKQRDVTTRIDFLDYPHSFKSTLVKGPFASMTHEHYFKSIQNGTLLIDVLEYRLSFGAAGRMADRLLVQSFLKKYLEAKNRFIKQYAEGEKWKVVISTKGSLVPGVHN